MIRPDQFVTPADADPSRNAVECAECRESMDAPHGPFGAVMVTEWIKQHKCLKPRWTR